MNRFDISFRSTYVRMVALAVFLLSLSAGLGCSSSSSETDAGAHGQRLYRQNCALCHGIQGEGKPSLGASLQANEYVASKSDVELVQFLAEGRAADHPDNNKGVAMPPRGGNPRLTDEDLASIVSHLRSFE